MGKIELIANWKHAWKMTSVWVFIIVGAFPDIYNAVVAAGFHDELPPLAANCLRGMAIVGIGLRVIKQKALTELGNKDDEKRRD